MAQCYCSKIRQVKADIETVNGVIADLKDCQQYVDRIVKGLTHLEEFFAGSKESDTVLTVQPTIFSSNTYQCKLELIQQFTTSRADADNARTLLNGDLNRYTLEDRLFHQQEEKRRQEERERNRR